MSHKKIHMKNKNIARKSNIKKLLLIVLFIATIFEIYPTLSKYISSTPEQIITILTKYHVNYQTSEGTILQPEKFNSYVSQTGLVLPIEGEVIKTSYDFKGWYDNNDFKGDAISEIKSGDTGDKLYFAAWKVSEHTLTVKTKDNRGNTIVGLPENYEIVIGKDSNGKDNVVSLSDSGTTIIGKNQVVSIRRKYLENMDVDRFSFDNEKIVVEIRYEEGNQYIYYDFNMPSKDLTLTFAGEINNYIDISKSSIIFEENVKTGSIIENGFWYKSSIRGMTPVLYDKDKGNFYIWNNSDPLYITSNNIPTQNQIKVVNTTTLYFKNCVMPLNSEYFSKVIGHHIGGVSVLGETGSYLPELLGKDFSAYANIIVDESIHPKYDLNIYTNGDNNQIGAIFSDQVRDTNIHNVLITFNHTESYNKLKLGTAFGNFQFNLINGVELYQDECPENSFEFLLYSFNSSLNVTNSTIRAKDKSIMILHSSMAFSGSSKVEVKDIFSYSGFTTYGNSYTRVHNNIYYGYVPLKLCNSSSVVVDGSIIANYMHWSGVFDMSSTGYLIVKGNRVDMSSMIIRNTHVICNTLTIGKSFETSSNAMIITNQIVNIPEKGFSINKEGNIVYQGGMGQCEPTTKENGDNYPFITYSQKRSGNVEYTFDSNVYLFGHYKVNGEYYDTSVKAMDGDNPIRPYIEKLLNENGDLKSTAEADQADYIVDKNIIIKDIKDSENTNKETVVIGNSKYNYDGLSRKVVIKENANIYSAGNLSFFNEVTMHGGYVYANGNMTSKNDLIVEGGEIEVNGLGNSYNLKKEEIANIFLWYETNIKGGTIKADNIGAIENSSIIDDITPRSTVTIDKEKAKITNKKGEKNSEITNDIYINYIFNSTMFTNENTSNNLRLSFLGDASSINWNIENDVEFINPHTISGQSDGCWKYNELLGPSITKIDKEANLLDNTNIIGKVYDNKNVKLYATKNSYMVNVVNECDYTLVYSENDTDINPNNVLVDKNITLRLDDNTYINKVVISYKDDAGTIHNVMPTRQGNDIIFKMPPANVDIYITNEIILDLDKSSYKINSEGYIIENGSITNDNVFQYDGDLIIEQSSILEGNTRYFSREEKKEHTKNRITIDSNFNNMDNTRNITLRKIYQFGGTDTIGLKLEDGANAKIKLSGPIQLCRVEVSENSKITLEGVNGNDTDILSIIIYGDGVYNNIALGKYKGKSGEIYLKDIKLYTNGNQFMNHVGESEFKTEANITYDNCRMEHTYWYSGAFLAKNFNNVYIKNNSVFNITAANNWPSPLFSGVNNVTIENSILNLKYNSATSAASHPLHSGISGELIIDHSTVTTSLREHDTTDIYKTFQDNSIIPPVVRIQNGATYITDKKTRFKKIIIDKATMIVGNNADGYLFATDIELNNNAKLNAGNILISGFYDTKNIKSNEEAVTRDDVIAKLKVNSNILDGSAYSGIVINSGTVNIKDFIGGDVNGKVVINGGVLNAKFIGNKGDLYGYGTYVPRSGEEYVYTYSKIPAIGTKVTVNGGIVNVTNDGYLGGMYAQVDINGGIVNLSENAIIGINGADTTRLVNSITAQGNVPNELVDININGGTIVGSNGSINVPYSTLDVGSISSNPRMNIKDVLAENGTINIKSTADYYDNPLEEGNRVGTIINNNLIAQNIEIRDGAVVYAYSAISKTNTNSAKGYLKVAENSYLYTNHYGTEGNGTSIIISIGTLVGNRNYTIQYVMNDTYEDKATNTNPARYTYGETLILEEPTRFGYEFDGWYDNAGNKVTQITNTDEGNKILNARWIEKTVEFVVSINVANIGITKEQFATEVDKNLGSLNESGDKFTYTNHVKISYHALFNTGLLLSNYNLSSYVAIEAKIYNSVLNPDEYILNLTSDGSTITREIMEYYLKNDSQPIEIAICGFIYNINEVNMENNIENTAENIIENDEGNKIENTAENTIENNEGNKIENTAENIIENNEGNKIENTAENIIENDEGNKIENTAGNKIENTAENKIENTAGNKIENNAGNKVENTAGNKIENTAENKIENTAENNIENNVGNKIENNAENNTEDNIENNVMNNI